MIERDGDRLILRGSITFAQAAAWRDSVVKEIDRGGLTIDLAGIEESDSTALSLLLECTRAAKSRGFGVTFANLPPNLRSLAEVYGVLELIPLTGSQRSPVA